MGTRARIGLYEAGQVRSIYSHWDGYPEGVGKILVESFTTVKKLTQLLDLGDISSLRSEIGKKHDFQLSHHELPEGDPRKQWTTAYGRDRGETDHPAITHRSTEWPDSGQDYEYWAEVGENGVLKWYVRGIVALDAIRFDSA